MRVHLCRTCGMLLGLTDARSPLEPGRYRAEVVIEVDCAKCHKQKGGETSGVTKPE